MGWFRMCKDFSLESLQHKGKRQNPDSFNHHSHHSAVTGKNQWLTAFNQSSALGRSIQEERCSVQGATQICLYISCKTLLYNSSQCISQCHSLFRLEGCMTLVSFVSCVWRKTNSKQKCWLITKYNIIY